jgi:hypothetical protein
MNLQMILLSLLRESLNSGEVAFSFYLNYRSGTYSRILQ